MAVQDGVLSDSELNDFQVHCFAVPLQPEELSGVKTVVLKGMREVSLPPANLQRTDSPQVRVILHLSREACRCLWRGLILMLHRSEPLSSSRKCTRVA